MKNMTIGKKITMGFGIILALLIILSVWAILGTDNVVENAEEVITGNILRGEMAQREIDHLNWAGQVSNFLMDSNAGDKLNVEVDPRKCAFGQWYYGEGRRQAEKILPALAAPLRDIEAPHSQLHESANEIGKVFVRADSELPKFIAQIEAAHMAWINNLVLYVNHTINDFKGELDHTKCTYGSFLYGEKGKQVATSDSELASFMRESEEPHRLIHEGGRKVIELLREGKNNDAQKIMSEQVDPSRVKLFDILKKMDERAEQSVSGMIQANQIFVEKTQPNLQKVQALLGQIGEVTRQNVMTDEAMLASANQCRAGIVGMSLVAFIAGVLIAIYLVTSIVKMVSSIVKDLLRGAHEVGSASSQVSQSSQSLAQAANEQAASLEESASSIEEMASMTKRNTENTFQASKMSEEAREFAERAGSTTDKMIEAIGKIKDSSDQTAKIVKTIDEIAFQTNLLALNAAVEAARAGEAGKGFAVVAEEVRNLAQRAGEAAKNTSALIQESKQNADNGVKVSEEVGQVLLKIKESVLNISTLINEVSSASGEQKNGIDEINRAIAELQKITQENAANSEETAAASEEMTAQAEELNRVVNILSDFAGVK